MLAWIALGAIVAGTWGCAEQVGSAGVDPSTIEVPDPELQKVDPQVQQQVRELRANVVQLLSEPETEGAVAAQAIGELGQLYQVYELRDAARSCYASAAALEPTGFRWPHLDGLIARDLGDTDGALAAFERAVELNPESAASTVRLADLLRETGEWDRAGELYGSVLAAEPEHAAAIYGTAQIAAKQGDHQKASELFEQTLALQPQAASVHFPLAQSYRSLGRVDDARLELKLAGQREVAFADPVAAELSRARFFVVINAVRALIAEPGEMSERDLLNFVISKAGDSPQFRQVLGGDLAEMPRTAPGKARLHYVVGGLAVSAGEDSQAIAQFRQALTLDNDLQDAHIKLGNALMRSGELRIGMGHFRRAIELDPQDSEARLKYASALLNLRQPDQAEEILAALAKEHPDDPVVAVRLSQVRELRGDLGGARTLLERALGAANDDKARAKIHRGFGDFLRRRGNLEAAVEQYELARSRDNDLIDAQVDLAAVLGQLGRFEESAERYRGIITQKPDHMRARLGEAAALILLERYDDARRRLAEGVATLPASAELAHLMARMLTAAPSEGLRDGTRGLELAQAAYEAQPGAVRAETVAMALAELGRYDEAASWQQRAMQAPQPPEGAERRLDLYRASRPFRISSPADLLAVDRPERRG